RPAGARRVGRPGCPRGAGGRQGGATEALREARAPPRPDHRPVEILTAPSLRSSTRRTPGRPPAPRRALSHTLSAVAGTSLGKTGPVSSSLTRLIWLRHGNQRLCETRSQGLAAVSSRFLDDAPLAFSLATKAL